MPDQPRGARPIYVEPIRFRGLGNGILRANVGTHSIIVEPRGNHLGGFLLTVDGVLVAGPAPRDRLLRQGQSIAQTLAADDDAALAFSGNGVEDEAETTTKETIMPTQKLTNRERVRRMHAKGKTPAEMAKTLGITATRVTQIMLQEGLVRRASRHPERDARIVEALDGGESIAVVAEREQVGASRVRTIYQVAKAGSA